MPRRIGIIARDQSRNQLRAGLQQKLPRIAIGLRRYRRGFGTILRHPTRAVPGFFIVVLGRHGFHCDRGV